MYISKPILAILAVLILFAALAEAVLVARVTRGFVVHEYHGILNGKVGQPYGKLVDELLTRHESGDVERLGRALEAAAERKNEMNHSWLNDETSNAYRDSVDAILRE